MVASRHVVVVGAGPAGLTAAYELARHGIGCDVLEADRQVGGISRTVECDGWRFDLGGHRFFTKVTRVNDFWHEILQAGDFLLRPRMSRIYYNSKYFDYPLRAMNALRNLGVIEAVACIASYGKVRIKPPKDTTNFEGWVASRFGWRLYRTFFKTYTEKVWGVPDQEIQADWAAQRIKNLSLGKAVVNAILPKGRNSTEVTSLIEQFQYPKFGPGMMWEACTLKVEALGQAVHLGTRVEAISRSEDGRVVATVTDGRWFKGDHLISSMPINTLVEVLNPPAPDPVRHAARQLRHRDFLTVALVVPQEYSFPDNWIYIHSPEARVGRIQNYGSWSPHMIKEGRTCLGLEYFVSEGDDLWEADDRALIDLATRELHALDLVPYEAVEAGYVVRVPQAYPIYDANYSTAVEVIREYLDHAWPQIHPVVQEVATSFDADTRTITTTVVLANEFQESVVVDLNATAQAALGTVSARSLGIAAVVVISDRAVLGGVDSSGYHYGGEVLSACTSGFGTRASSSTSGTRGIATAGHCGNSQNDDGSALTYQGGHVSTHGDFQWHIWPRLESDDFYAGTASTAETNLRDVSAVGLPTVGQTLCKNGATNHASCQEVRALHHCNGSACNLVMMGARLAAGGDSGGPIYWANTAYGLHQGWKYDPVWPADRDLFSRADRIDNALGVWSATNSQRSVRRAGRR